MFIETWRWRMVMFLLGLGLACVGGFCVLHPNAIPLNICNSRDVVFLQHLNVVVSALAFLAVFCMGALFIGMVGHSVRKGRQMEREAKEVDYCELRRTVLAYVLIAVAIGLAVFVGQYFLKGTNLDPKGSPAQKEAANDSTH